MIGRYDQPTSYYTPSDGKEISFELKKNTFQEKLPRDDSEPPTYPRVNVPMFSDEEILNATKSLNRQAATAIDGYTKDLLLQAFEQDASIISLFGTLLHWILTTNMSHAIRRILLLNRGVAIPKMDGGVRPICVSSTLLKIIGVIAMKRDGAPPSAIQMAIGVKEGHVRIAHRVREHVETHESSAVIRVDISNAFGNMPRTLIHSMLQKRE